ncbi:MAG: hypothetical protein KatS3mg044_0041 [Rhodothermaceae bacterium]|nr:MAG: hypothetical protein KatS3mg044_0041 [Rhodothermaceae bacterium]
MTLEYYPDTDTLYIALRDGQSADAAEVAADFVLDFDEEGRVIGMTIEHASERVDLRSFAAMNVPVLVA